MKNGQTIASLVETKANGNSVTQLAAIGQRTGVAEIFGFRFSGLVAWLMWRTIYLMKLPRLEEFRNGLE